MPGARRISTSSRSRLPPSSPDGTPPGFLAFTVGRLDAALTLRAAGEADAALLAAIYACTRDEELRQVGWIDAQKKAFTDWQSQQQERHYALHYPDAERLVIERDVPIGRIYVHTSAEVRLMEMTLLPGFRNQGIGTSLMNAFLAYADQLGRPASLHVEPFNPARRMYERMGFDVVESRGIYEYMRRPAARTS
jgi:GNAT superfamily N-acetyltransferase